MSLSKRLKSAIKFALGCLPRKQVIAQVTALGPSELLNGRLTLITGGTSGIGKAIAKAFLSAGADVIITGRQQEKISNVIQELKNHCSNRECYGMIMDLSDSKNLPKVFDDIVNHFSNREIDILVNCAGLSIAPSDDISTEADNFDKVIATNLKGTYLLSKLVGDYMIERNIKGNILIIASTSSNRPATNAYSLSKWGVKGLIIGLAKVLIRHNIVVNGIAPGPTVTPMMNRQDGDNIALANNPSGRFALPAEIASMAVVLTSGIGRLVVGDLVYMGGGSGVITVDDINY